MLYINDKVALSAKNIEKLTFSNGKMTISEATPKHGFHYPSVMVDLKDVEISFTIKYTNQHLDMFWHSTGKKVTNSHGLIGELSDIVHVAKYLSIDTPWTDFVS